MKPFGYLLAGILCLCSYQYSFSQSKINPWTATFGTNAVNNPVRDQIEDIGRFKTWNWNAAGFRLSAGRLIANRLTFEGVISLNTIAENYENLDANYPYISVDGMFRVQLTKGLSVFDPYITLGGGYTWLDTIGAGTVNGGVGVNLWLGPKFGFTIQTVYKHAFELYGLQHYQHSAGMVFKFGKRDLDNDGIVDDKDLCPNLFGNIETQGCPDNDADGVANSEDLCPDNFGSAKLRGCPDSDKDGTPDKFDQCPKLPGAVKDKGCPFQDRDKDGIADNLDKCPKQAGPLDNAGCPKAKSNRKPTPQAATQKQNILERNNSIKEKVRNDLKALASRIHFNPGTASLTLNAKSALNAIVQLMNTQRNMKFHIAGHTDSMGSSKHNLLLSEKRATIIKSYLIAQGVDSARLSSQGYGEDNPIADNNTADGRSQNRRVEIFISN